MKEYVCSVCGYVHKGEIPDDFVCPLCGAGRSAFYLKEEKPAAKIVEKPHTEKQLTPIEISIICSNLARGCEKQYLPEQAAAFTKLADYFKSQAKTDAPADFGEILKLVENDLSQSYPYATQTADKYADRGAARAVLWSERVTNMLNSVLLKYGSGDIPVNTGVYVCTICGFIYIGDQPPETCPVCKVPSWKFEKIQGRQNNG